MSHRDHHLLPCSYSAAPCLGSPVILFVGTAHARMCYLRMCCMCALGPQVDLNIMYHVMSKDIEFCMEVRQAWLEVAGEGGGGCVWAE
jgi:hypothetical protein